MTQGPSILPPVYPLLAQTRNLAADRVLVDALPVLDEGYREIALDTLIQRGREHALGELVARFHEFDDSLQALIVANLDGAFAGVRVAIGAEDFETRASAIDLIGRGGNAKLAYLLAGALSQRCPKTRALAAEGMNRLAQEYLERRAAVRAGRYDPTLGEWGRALAAAVRQALASWEAHFRTEIVAVAIWLVDYLEDLIIARMSEPRSKLAHAFNEVLRAVHDPGKAGYLVRMLRVPALRAKAARMIAACRDTATMTALLDECWVLADPEVTRSLSRIRSLAWLDGGIAPLFDLSRRRVLAAGRFIGAIGLNADRKVALLQEMSDSGHSALGEAAVWQLLAIRSDAANSALRRIAKRETSWSRVAVRELERRSQTVSAAPAGPAASPAPEAPEDSVFNRYWERFDDLASNERAALAHKLHDEWPGFDRRLRAKLTATDPSDRVRGVLLVRVLGLAGQMDTQLYSLAHDPDAMVRSAVLVALQQLDNPTSRRILYAALHDTDERVQANAVEALDALEAIQFTDQIKEKLESPSNRVRANAVFSLLKIEVHEAADTLLAMVGSDSRADRLSALWVIECLQLQSLADRLVELSANDPDPQVRHRARRIAETVGLSRANRTPADSLEAATG